MKTSKENIISVDRFGCFIHITYEFKYIGIVDIFLQFVLSKYASYIHLTFH